MTEIGLLHTEGRNPASVDLDLLSAAEIVALMNREDATVAKAVAAALPQVAMAVDCAAQALRAGGRILYAGAGTSGRLGVLDAAECRPTFGVSDSQVIGLMAGGASAFTRAQEGVEDAQEAGSRDARSLNLTAHDVLIALSASGRTPYAIGALVAARQAGSKTVAVACNRNAVMSAWADIAIEVDTGPEILTGSTRLKAGTAQKMVLNMISTGAMVRSGRVYENWMVDMLPSNEKLIDRAERMIEEITGTTREQAAVLLRDAHYQVKSAIVMGLLGISYEAAGVRLQGADGFVRGALEVLSQPLTDDHTG